MTVPSTRRNPPWQRDELILALDLFFRHNPNHISQNHPEVVKLSEVLNGLPIHIERPDQEKFRNANGVYMKLCNFLRYDSSYKGRGLVRGGRLEKVIWDEFSADKEVLRRVAQAIINGQQDIAPTTSSMDEDEWAFPEGRVLYRLHRQRERRTDLVRKTKQRAQKAGGLRCTVCAFDFAAEYGEIGEGYIECHHTVPISEYEIGQETRLQDLALVCANCHRMLHRRRPWLTINELSQLRQTARA
ncbi:MAG TPA: HNH endonuclease [Planctomycetaceae bacterium]|nr:HNH endonuclease [Planctomycetaceae bacterium]